MDRSQKIDHMSMYLHLLFIVFIGIFPSCQADSTPQNSKCKGAYNMANSLLNEFYQKADQSKLDTALYIVERNINVCPDYDTRMVNLKIRMLILLKADDRGYKFVDSLDENKFDKPYKKSLYLKNFKAMGLEKRGDSLSRNHQYLEIIDDVLKYIKLHPSDKEAIADLFFIKAKVEEKSKILKSIDTMRRQSKDDDSLFYEGLKSLVIGNEVTTPAVHQQ